ncbi:Na+/H+ antiporter [Leifsonia sp. Leaf264]|uniref:Na+/H+ antiporter n=1 Tax=Leifsonia sp. Leaf264 TaxID=1736314 RepID=UPI0006FDC401|nr:Na+/H+ antiporter [Leifsonia sp. Leaf264]KQO97691.1 sodium:proton antiporter [Leifsonia sp. Leaf264]
MLALEVIVAIGLAVLIGGLIAARLRVTTPIVLIPLGVLLGFIPAFREVELPPEAVLLLFLPVLLFWESLTTSTREIRRFIRVILLNGTLLVFVTALGVAVVGTWFGLPWIVALVLGAVLAPTDATAVSELAGSLPRRQRTVLRAESLINDGTALVIYALAVSVAVSGQQISPLEITWTLLVSYVGGVAIGVGMGFLGSLTLRIRMPLLSNVGLIITPFAAFLIAEVVGSSGVLAVVVCGLVMSRIAPRVARPEARDQAQSFWTVTTYLLNAALFVLIGLELQVVLRELPPSHLGLGVVFGVVVWIALIVIRALFIVITTTIIRTVDRRPYQRTLRASPRALVMAALAGFRGAVSLAAVLAVPTVLASGDAFPDRDLVVFVTTVVIVLTLGVQGPILPLIIRWARLPADDGIDEERNFAELAASRAAIEALPGIASELGVDDSVRDKVLAEAEQHVSVLEAAGAEEPDEETTRHKEQYNRLRLAALEVKRETIVSLRDEKRIDDIVLRRIQSQLDLEELRLTGRELE